MIKFSFEAANIRYYVFLLMDVFLLAGWSASLRFGSKPSNSVGPNTLFHQIGG